MGISVSRCYEKQPNKDLMPVEREVVTGTVWSGVLATTQSTHTDMNSLTTYLYAYSSQVVHRTRCRINSIQKRQKTQASTLIGSLDYHYVRDVAGTLLTECPRGVAVLYEIGV